MTRLTLLLLPFFLLTGCGDTNDSTDRAETDEATATIETPAEDPTMGAEKVQIHPVFHASVVLEQGGKTIFVDPYDNPERFSGFGAPDLVLITHTHPDHLNPNTLKGLDLGGATIVGPAAVTSADIMDSLNFADAVTMDSGDTHIWEGIDIAAVPAYNVPSSPDAFHPEGKFIGYVVTMGGTRIYFSGDTGPAPEVKDLEAIDVAFVCMNRPYTMTPQEAAETIIAMKPDRVYPYHYRNKDETMANRAEFRQLVLEGAPDTEVILEDWYPEAR